MALQQTTPAGPLAPKLAPIFLAYQVAASSVVRSSIYVSYICTTPHTAGGAEMQIRVQMERGRSDCLILGPGKREKGRRGVGVAISY